MKKDKDKHQIYVPQGMTAKEKSDLHLEKLKLFNENGKIVNKTKRKELINEISKALDSPPTLVAFDFTDILYMLNLKNYKFKFKKAEVENLKDIKSSLPSITTTDVIFFYIKIPQEISIDDILADLSDLFTILRNNIENIVPLFEVNTDDNKIKFIILY